MIMKSIRKFSHFIHFSILLTWLLGVCCGQSPFPPKIATQSVTWQTSTADRAIDGNQSTCSLTAVNPGSLTFGWWQVDLGGIFTVYNVTVTSGTNDGTHPEYLQNFTITVGDTNSTEYISSNLCYYFNNGSYVPAQTPLTLTCSHPLNGRYVTIKRQGGDRQDAIGFCEVNIGYSTVSSSTATTTSSSQRTFGISTTNPTRSEPPNSTNSTALENREDNKTRTTIICVVVIIGGLLLIGGIAGLVYFLLKSRIYQKTIGRKKIEILPFRRMSESPLAVNSADHELLTKPIRESDLAAYVGMRKSNPASFTTEFKKLPEDEARAATLGRKSDNKTKNRFANVLPYDHTLVPLEIEEFDDPEGDYINASYIEGYKNVNKMYIATQGPRSNTLDDFWRMIWQQKVNLIVMVTSLMEGGKKKCEKYWSESLHSRKVFHKISVTLTVEETYAHYAYREMLVHDERKEDEPPRTVRQMHFLTWNDKTRPDHFLSILSFRRKVRALQKDTTGPVVVHCSAGIGRTGTYIALDTMLEQLKAEQEVSIFGCVESLRYQRMGMVQTAEQYVFLHEALADGTLAGDTGIPCSTFLKDYVEMAKPWPDGSLSSLEQQFILLRKLKEFKTEKYSSGSEKANLSKNRNTDIVAYDEGRPYLESTYNEGNDYINAVYADSYRLKEAFILTQLPLQETIVDFWSLVWDYRLKTIVLLNEINPNDESCPTYWPETNTTETYGPFEVEIVETKEFSQTITLRDFTLSNTKDKRADALSVQQYQLKGWPNNSSVPDNSNILLELINILMATSNRETIVIQCIDGTLRSGLFATAMYMTDMMKVEQVVDAFLASRFIAMHRPQVVDLMEQYSLLHDLACTCIMQYDEYGNCKPVAIKPVKPNGMTYENALDLRKNTACGLSETKSVKLGEF